jgi:hypothetical protein
MRTFGRLRGWSTSASGGCERLGRMPRASPRWAPSGDDGVRRRAGFSGARGADSIDAERARRRLSTRTRTLSKGTNTKRARMTSCWRVTVSSFPA